MHGKLNALNWYMLYKMILISTLISAIVKCMYIKQNKDIMMNTCCVYSISKGTHKIQYYKLYYLIHSLNQAQLEHNKTNTVSVMNTCRVIHDKFRL